MTQGSPQQAQPRFGRRRLGVVAALVGVVVAVVLLTTVVGLGASQRTAGDVATSEPCALLTREEVATHVGDDLIGRGGPAPPGSIPPIAMTGMGWCKYPWGEKATAWVGATPPGADATFATELFENWLCGRWKDAFDDCEQHWQTEFEEWERAEELADDDIEPVGGLGVAAVWREPSTLVVLTDRQVLAFFLDRCDNRFAVDGGERERARRLAQLVLDRRAQLVLDRDARDERPDDRSVDEVDGVEEEETSADEEQSSDGRPPLAPECAAHASQGEDATGGVSGGLDGGDGEPGTERSTDDRDNDDGDDDDGDDDGS